MAPKQLGRRLDRIAVATATTAAPSPAYYDYSCFTPEEMWELDTLLAKVQVGPDGRADYSTFTDAELDALERLCSIYDTHQARTEIPVESPHRLR